MTLTGHAGGVRSLTTHNGNIVSGSSDYTIKIWDLKTNKVRTLTGHTNIINSLVIHNEKIISGSADNTIKIWDLKTNKVKTLIGHTNEVFSLTTLDEKIISGSIDSTIKVWDLEEEKVKTLTGHKRRELSLTTDDGKIVSGSADGTIRIWKLDEDELHTLALKAMLEGDLSDPIIEEDGQGNLNIGGIIVKIQEMATAVMSMAGMFGGDGDSDAPLSIDPRILGNVVRILSHQPIDVEEWRPISAEDIANPQPTWRVFKRGDRHTMQYVRRDLQDKDEDVPLGVTGHETFHLLYTDDDAWEEASSRIEEKDLRSAFQWLMNAHEDPRVNERGVERLPGMRVPLEKLYNKYYPTKFKDLKEAQVTFNMSNPLHIQYGLMVIHDWFYDELHPLVTDPVLIKTYEELREESVRAYNEHSTEALASVVSKRIWEGMKKLIDRSEEQMKNNELLEKMIDDKDIDFDEMDGETTSEGKPLPLDMLPEELQEKLRQKIQDKWDSLTDEEKKELEEKIRAKIRDSEDKNNGLFDPKIKVEEEDIDKIKKAFNDREEMRRDIEEAKTNAKHDAGSGAGIGEGDFLEREGVTAEDYAFYQKYYNEVSGQATTLKNYLRRIKFAEKKKRVLRRREEGEIDEDELPGVAAGEYRIFKEVRKKKGMYFKISFLVDLSESMHTQERIEEAMRGLIILLETIEEWPKDIIFEVVGYSNTNYIPISEYNAKDMKLKDKVDIIKQVHELGKGGTNAAEAVGAALQRNIKGDKKFRRIVFLITDGELLPGDSGEIDNLTKQYPATKLVPIGLGEGSSSIESISNGRWLPEMGQFADEMYKIMDLEFRVHANGRRGFGKLNPEWGRRLSLTKSSEARMQRMLRDDPSQSTDTGQEPIETAQGFVHGQNDGVSTKEAQDISSEGFEGKLNVVKNEIVPQVAQYIKPNGTKHVMLPLDERIFPVLKDFMGDHLGLMNAKAKRIEKHLEIEGITVELHFYNAEDDLRSIMTAFNCTQDNAVIYTVKGALGQTPGKDFNARIMNILIPNEEGVVVPLLPAALKALLVLMIPRDGFRKGEAYIGLIDLLKTLEEKFSITNSSIATLQEMLRDPNIADCIFNQGLDTSWPSVEPLIAKGTLDRFIKVEKDLEEAL